MTSKRLRVIKIKQPLGEFYIGAIRHSDLLDISTVEVRNFQHGNTDKLAGIQRQLSKSRLKELRQYVTLDYATFPTSVILAVSEHSAALTPIAGCNGLFELVISDFPGDQDLPPIPLNESAFILDGQHRLAGLESLARNRDFELNVSIFVGADESDQAEIFSRVNLAQTKVNKSLVYDLFEYSKEKSPQKVAHELAIALNRDDTGPFYRRIKRLGIRTPGIDTETLTQATVVKGLLRHLPPNQERERTKSILGIGSRSEDNESWRDRIFVDFYRKNQKVDVFDNVSNYFAAVRNRWPGAWDEIQPGAILNRTTGFDAFIRLLKDVYLLLVDSPRVVTINEYYEVLCKVAIEEQEFNRDNFKPGSSGAGELYRRSLDDIKKAYHR